MQSASRCRWLALTLAASLGAAPADAACCYFAAKDKDILQPAQKAFITWDPVENVESFTVQPKFEGNARDFGMVIPTPGRPKLDEMPRDFFKELAIYTLLKRREQPSSALLFAGANGLRLGGGLGPVGGGLGAVGGMLGGFGGGMPRPPAVQVLETGIVGSLDYKIITAQRADDLFTWLKQNKYSYSGDEATLDFYVQKKWYFTVMKIDTTQMKRKSDGTFDGEVTPTRLQFPADKLVYPLRITRISVKDKTEALLYVQAPYKVDLPDEMTYQYQWIPMLQNAHGWYAKGTFGARDLPGKADDWLKSAEAEIPALLAKGNRLGFAFANNQRPAPGQGGRTPTTLEWAKRLTAKDVAALVGRAPYSEKVPNVDDGFTAADLTDLRKGLAARTTIEKRLEKSRLERPGGYLVREAPMKDVLQLKILAGHLKAGQFVTKIRKTFTKAEMDDDLLLVPARLGQAEDASEYEEILPTSPP